MGITKVVKGSLYIRERGLMYKFMFNPAEIEITKETLYPKETPAGGSHPIYNFASGGEYLVTFTLMLDGDRGRDEARPRRSYVGDANSGGMTNALNQLAYAGDGSSNTSYSITDEIKLLQSLLLPSQYGKTAREVYPYPCLFTYGSMFKAVPAIVKKADPKINMTLPNGDPIKAAVSMQLGLVVPTYQTAGDYLYGAPGSAVNSSERPFLATPGFNRDIGGADSAGMKSLNPGSTSSASRGGGFGRGNL